MESKAKWKGWTTEKRRLAFQLSVISSIADACSVIGCSRMTLIRECKRAAYSYKKSGENHHCATVSNLDVEFVRILGDYEFSVDSISKIMSMTKPHISMINNFSTRIDG